ncbi:hypothetical protein [Ferrimonas balearica]|uniref:hypothetical protein n=1 Tax=Ferrimonas balearica TaxID=44012 RepID=UPI001C994BBE|nr:hypothetical protein [Ferrimonas balearica]MBY5992850.1 hypothetical protein [Ferrimonas balearica]
MRLVPLAVLSGAVLMGCGSDSDSQAPGLTDQQLIDTIECSNLAWGKPHQPDSPCTANSYQAWADWDANLQHCKGQYCFEDYSPAPANPGLTRFPQGHLIPTYSLYAEDPRFVRAMDKAEALVGYKLFDRRGVIELDISNWFDIDYSDLPTEWGFIWSQGTTGGNCSSGTVSRGPWSMSLVGNLANPQQGLVRNLPGEFTWINIDGDEENAQEGCTVIASDEVTLHELGHALGMKNHFRGFGDGAAFDANAERVLRTMYNPQNPEGQPFDALYLVD